MMSKLKTIIAMPVRFGWVWVLIRPFAKLGAYLWNKRNEFEEEESKKRTAKKNEAFLNGLFPERKVLNGPFKGLHYPSFDSVGSTLIPKLIGSYEKELHSILGLIIVNQYAEIINIGCGEGYYSVGLSLQIPTAKVIAYDTNEEARKLCRKMAEINGVSDRIEIGTFCSASILNKYKFTKGFIICDCEGYEIELFNQSNVDNLASCDLLIETHDFIDITISDRIRSIFAESHVIKIIKSLDDIEKARTYSFPQTEHFDLVTRRKIFAEGRPAIMEWLFLSSKLLEHER